MRLSYWSSGNDVKTFNRFRFPRRIHVRTLCSPDPGATIHSQHGCCGETFSACGKKYCLILSDFTVLLVQIEAN